MSKFPLSFCQEIIQFAISTKIINKKQISKVKEFFKQISSYSKEVIDQIETQDYLKDMFSKEQFLEIYSLYLSQNDRHIKELFVDVPYIDLDEININIEELAEVNEKIKKIVQKSYAFVIKTKGKNYLVISLPLDRATYNDIRNTTGPYKLVVGYPYDVFEICNKIIEKIGEKFLESTSSIIQNDIIRLVNFEKPLIDTPIKSQISLTDIKINLPDLNERKLANTSISRKDRLQNLMKKKFVIIGSPSTNDPEVVKAFIEEGIEAIKLHLNMTHPVSHKKMGSYENEKQKILSLVVQYPSVVWGIVPGNLLTDKESFQEIDYSELEAFFDFIDLFYHSYTSHYLLSGLEKIVAIDKVITKEELDVFSKYKFLAIEASIVDKSFYGFPLTLKDITDYRRLIENTDIPVFIPTQKKIIPSDIKILYSIGARGIVLGQISTSFEIDKIRKTVSEFLEYSHRI